MNHNNYQIIQQYLQKYDHIFLFHHRWPDGDCLGSKYGLKELIKKNFSNKKVYCIGDCENLYNFLPFPEDNVYDLMQSVFKNSLAIVLDTGPVNSIQAIEILRKFPFCKRIRIDHHNMYNPDFFDFEWVDTSYVAVAEQIAHLATQLNWDITPLGSNYLYLGIYTDSGRLRFEKTVARTFKIMSWLINKKADVFSMNVHLSQRSEHFTRFIAKVWQQFIISGRFAYYVVSQNDIEQFHLNVIQANDANLLGYLHNIDVWAFFVQISPTHYRCRIRSNSLDISSIFDVYNVKGSHYFSNAYSFEQERLAEVVANINHWINEQRK